MSTTKSITGFIVGAAVGGALGILFAPGKGVKTRRKLADKGNDLANSVKDQINGFAGNMKDKLAFAKSVAEDVEEKSRN